MASTGENDNELRRQLREAWQKIADLEWQLQTEQRNSKRQERMLVSSEGAMADAQGEYNQELADREQEIADLEDSQTGRFDREDLQRLRDLLSACADSSEDEPTRRELLHWARRCKGLLGTEDAPQSDGITGAFHSPCKLAANVLAHSLFYCYTRNA